ncbi:MAG: hypothetical protein J3K34DRAFT_9457 [Monoraphidium minutum]|nr:MAG: hypothetical protein J3K34DRAFT_9457 [Monoraphidium minutum]
MGWIKQRCLHEPGGHVNHSCGVRHLPQRRPCAPPQRLRRLLLLLLLALLLSVGVSGQGFVTSDKVAEQRSQRFGASDARQKAGLNMMTKRALDLANSWQRFQGSTSAPSNVLRSGGSTGTSGAGSREDALTLVMAASPFDYSSTAPIYTGGKRLVPGARDQQRPCKTSDAHAVVSAAEAAVAAATGLDVGHELKRLSVQDLFYCSPGWRDCTTGWDLKSTLDALASRGPQLLLESCLKYDARPRGDKLTSTICQTERKCTSLEPFASKGTFFYLPIADMRQAQKHLREWGCVVAEFGVYSDFEEFFMDARNAEKIYSPSPTAEFLERVVVLLVGYSNTKSFWEARISYGLDFANNGDFKIAYGAAGVLKADTFGVQWQPSRDALPARQPLATLPSSTHGCRVYTGQPGDYLSKVARLSGVDLEKLIIDNSSKLPDLGMDLDGVQLLLCAATKAAG